jgi:hypothetical protein
MKRLGEILLDWGVIAVSELHTGLEACHRAGGRLGTQLISFGFVDEHTLLEALSEQYGVPSVTERIVRRAPLEVRKLLPPKVARRMQAIPFNLNRDVIKVAMVNPRDPATIEEISEITASKVEPFVASESSLMELISELDNEIVDVVVQVDPKLPKVRLTPGDWERLWEPPQLEPARLLRVRRRRQLPDDRPLVATFPGLAPVLDASRGDSDHEIDNETYREQLARVRHRDEVGRLLLRYAGHYFTRLALFAVHKGLVLGWMARGHGVVLDDVQSLSITFEKPSLFADLQSGADHYMGPIPQGAGNDAVAEVLGEPRPSTILMVPIKVKERTVAYMMGDNPGEMTMTVPVEEIAFAVQKAGAAFEILIIRKKILS